MKLVPHTIHRSVLKELFTAFVLGLLTFNFILVTEKVLRLTKVFASVGASLTDMLKILLLMQPQITVLTAPIALLIAVLITYGRMGADNELVIMRASGMSFRQISMPVLLFGLACFVFTTAASFYAAPAGVKRLRETVSKTIARRAPLAIEEGIFNNAFRDIVLYVNERTPDGDLKDVFIYDERRKGEPTVLLAREGRIATTGDMNISFDLREGRIHIAKDNSTTVLSFGRYVLSFPFTLGSKPLHSFQELTPLKLWRAALGTRGEEEKTRILLELHRRLSLPALCLILMVLGPPLSLMAGRSGKMGGLAIGILVFALYYTAVVYTEGQAMAGKIPVWLGAWSPALVFGVVSALLFRRASLR
jgi:lipopolysaccharide export system permease protein